MTELSKHSKKRGRPKKEDSRSRLFRIRLSDNEFEILRSHADQASTTMSDYIRKLILEDKAM